MAQLSARSNLNRGCPTFRGFRKVGSKTDRSIPALVRVLRSLKCRAGALAAAFDPLAVDVPCPVCPCTSPSRELLIVDLQSKITNHQSTMICGSAELSVNLGLTRSHGSLLLEERKVRLGRRSHSWLLQSLRDQQSNFDSDVPGDSRTVETTFFPSSSCAW